MEPYTLDPHRISLTRFHELTSSKQLIPSRLPLLEMINQRFRILEESGITNVGELLTRFKNKQALAAFASDSGIPADYLVLLKREAGSYLARPFPLSDFPGIPFEYVEVLRARNIRNTKALFESAQTSGQQKQLSSLTGIPESRLQELWALSDLSRITGVGGVFARIVYQSGIRSVRQFAETDAGIQYEQYMAIIHRHNYEAGHFKVEDLEYCIDYARVILECYDKTEG